MRIYRPLLLGMLVVTTIGAVNAFYLATLAFAGVAPTCTIFTGCDVVAASSYSRIFGIPLALFGVFFYLSVGGLIAWSLITKTSIVRLVIPLTTLGLFLSLYFLYLQAFVIKAYCQYCLLSLIDATLLFVGAWFLWHLEKYIFPKDIV